MTPGKGGQDVEGVPVFNTFHDAVAETGANTAMIFVPPRFAADSILEAEDAGIALIIAITEGIPAHDELRVYNHLRGNPDVRLVGPNCPGILSPGKANVGIIPASFFKAGQRRRRLALGHADLPDRQRAGPGGFGNSIDRRHRRRPRPGLELRRHHRALRGRPETELIVMAGEIGGSAEEEAAEYIAAHVSKPVVAYIAGFTAPPGKTMGHAGAIVSGSNGTAAAKAEALEARRRARRPHADRGRGDRGRDRRLAEDRLADPQDPRRHRGPRERAGGDEGAAHAPRPRAADGDAEAERRGARCDGGCAAAATRP